MDYKSIIESKYNRNSWMQLLSDIFGNRAEFWQAQSMIRDLDKTVAQWAIQLGKITLKDGNIIAVYEVELAGSVQLERNRAAIRNLLCTHWRSQGCAGAFMFCQRKEESVLRFSYVSEAWTFKENGSYVKEATEPRRYTYYLGEGHRSRTAIDQFTKLKNSDFTLKALTKAFSVEAISDMFFDGYKKQYEDIILYITGKKMVKVGGKWEEKQMGEPCAEIMSEFARFENPEKSVRDYVKRLMGRLVFIQFLQKKGWMGVPAGDSWTGGDKEFLQHLFINSHYKDTFVDDVLEPLFNDLNKRRGDDLVSCEKVGTNIKVPYLNGGLFERSAEDDTAFPLPARYMQSLIVDFFAAYNFTIDENDPNDAEVGVDAEMLGRIFENLLEDNKDKGAFYTPKEIVQYMCRESLIAYLQTETGIEEARLRKFVTEHDIKDCIAINERQPLTNALHEVKICDPAIGSGAFPMGLLNELVACRAALGEDMRLGRAKIKRDIIQNNIYGVDIERGAVDIARLRFWLSLIVDEDNPEALPNMDFKIVQGNSLITTFNGKYLNLEENKSQVFQQIIKKEKERLHQLQKDYFAAIGERKMLLGIDIKTSLLNIVSAQFGFELRKAAFDQKVQEEELFEMSSKDIVKKIELPEDVQDAIAFGASLRQRLNDESIPVEERTKLELNFFDWKIMFADVFDSKGGFDIVIGNPPYIKIQNIDSKQANIIKGIYSTCKGKFDMYVPFVENAFRIMHKNGICTYIHPHRLLNVGYALDLRCLIARMRGLSKIIHFGVSQVFDATTYSGIFIYQRDTDHILFSKLNIDDTNLKNITFQKFEWDTIGDVWNFSTDGKNTILDKINNCSKKLLDVFDGIYQGLITLGDDIFMMSGQIKNGLFYGYSKEINENVVIEADIMKPVLKGENIRRYKNPNNSLYVIYPHFIDSKGKTKPIEEADMSSKYPLAYSYLLLFKDRLITKKVKYKTNPKYWYSLHRAREIKLFDSQKILTPQLQNNCHFTIDRNNMYPDAGGYMLIMRNEIKQKEYYYLGILNSRLFYYFIKSTSTAFNNDYYYFKTAYIEPFSFPTEQSIYVNKIISFVTMIYDKIEKTCIETTYEEREIDNLVYVLYDLTYVEVKVIEPEFPMTEAEYNEFKQQHQNQ